MKVSTLKKYIGILTDVKNSGLGLSAYCKQMGINYSNITQTIYNLRKQHDEESEMVSELLSLYNEVTGKTCTPVASVEEIDSENHVSVSYERDENGKILCYKYKIYKKDKPALDGTLTREEMSKIMRLYTWYGDGLTARIVSREFPQFSLPDLKRIFRAFSIYKDNCPFAPHDVEEKSIEELRSIQLREKENSFLRQAEEDQIKNTEKLLKKYAQENLELRKQLKEACDFKIAIPETPEPIILPEYQPVGQSINIYLSDIHLGAAVTTGTLYQENTEYGFDEAQRRLEEVLIKLRDFDCFDTINVVLLGDNVDCCGFTGKTTSLTHTMPENMDAREQGNKYIELMMWFIDSLVHEENALASKINIYSVPCGNHSGNFEYMCNKALLALINAKYPTINTTLWEEFFGIFEQNSHIFVACHGKPDQYMKKGLPLNLDEKTKVMLYEWLHDHEIYSDNVHFIKGDLHSNSLSSCKRLDYRNVLSLFGASDYSNYNFSRNSYGVSYDLFIGDNLVRGTFENI